MGDSICTKVVQALGQAEQHNSRTMVRPEAILWPDPERQWAPVIPALQERLPALLMLGSYEAVGRQGPAIWIKCMVARTLAEASWGQEAIPIIYLPGIGKGDLRNIQSVGLDLQPLIEYQYTGALFLQPNGQEWTVRAFLENQQAGLGLKVAQDAATSKALVKALPIFFEDGGLEYPATIDAAFFNALLFPDVVSSLLNWLCKGELPAGQPEAFAQICQSQYGFTPDPKLVKDAAEKLGAQQGPWKQVWRHYANAPAKYPEIEELLRLAKPDDLGGGIFALPEESWPQVNEEQEDELRKAMKAASKKNPKEALQQLQALSQKHHKRLDWVWAELGKAPLAQALQWLVKMAEAATESFPSSSLELLKEYYTQRGHLADRYMRKALAVVKARKDEETISAIIKTIYQPWLENLTHKFQALVLKDSSPFSGMAAEAETAPFVLFVDALRYELAIEFIDKIDGKYGKKSIKPAWAAIPTLTPTAKPQVAPLASLVNPQSEIREFRPQLLNGKDLLAPAFREALTKAGYAFVANAQDLDPAQPAWQEIGDIDTKGHEDQSRMVRRIDELFGQVQEAIDNAFEKGFAQVKIVTDHGWLLLPGGLPKEELKKDLVETRWGRCALIKEGAKTDLLQLPWRWNPQTFIAFAPGISFFKRNEEYAHGGISIHECLVPVVLIDAPHTSPAERVKISQIRWVNLTCKIETLGAPDGYLVDIRTKYSDPETSLVLSKTKALKDGKVTLMVNDEAEGASAAVVLMDARQTILDRRTIIVGS